MLRIIKGFVLPSVIYLMVFLAIILVAAYSAIKASSNVTVADIQGERAFWVAKSGLEYGFFMAKKNSLCSSSKSTVSMSGTEFSGFKFTYDCIATVENEAGVNLTFYTINVNACNTSGTQCPANVGKPDVENYAERSITGKVYAGF